MPANHFHRSITMKSIMFLLVASLAACSNPTDARPNVELVQLALVGGDGQADTVARTLPVAVVTAATANGLAATQVIVNWYRVAGSDTTFAGAALTDAAGRAQRQWTLLTRA